MRSSTPPISNLPTTNTTPTGLRPTNGPRSPHWSPKPGPGCSRSTAPLPGSTARTMAPASSVGIRSAGLACRPSQPRCAAYSARHGGPTESTLSVVGRARRPCRTDRPTHNRFVARRGRERSWQSGSWAIDLRPRPVVGRTQPSTSWPGLARYVAHPEQRVSGAECWFGPVAGPCRRRWRPRTW